MRCSTRIVFACTTAVRTIPNTTFSARLARGARRARPNQGNKNKGKKNKDKKNKKDIRLGT